MELLRQDTDENHPSIVIFKGKTTQERSYYISSSTSASAEQLLSIVKEHWLIESLHWMLDVVFWEDDCSLQSEEEQITLNCFRKFALLLHSHCISNLSKKALNPICSIVS